MSNTARKMLSVSREERRNDADHGIVMDDNNILKELDIMKRAIALSLLAIGLIAVSTVRAHEKVKLTGYVVDVVCAADHTKDPPEDATKFATEHTKECALMEECVKSGYGIFADGKWYPFDAKGNTLAKALFEKTAKKDHIKVTVEGMKHEGKILVEKLTEAD